MEARIHQWFDERCVEPRVQQIVLPSLWPRKKNTRGLEDPPLDEEEEGDDVMIVDGTAEIKQGNTPVETNFEARMDSEDKTSREADGRAINETPTKINDGMRRRPLHRAMGSMANFKIPGGFL